MILFSKTDTGESAINAHSMPFDNGASGIQTYHKMTFTILGLLNPALCSFSVEQRAKHISKNENMIFAHSPHVVFEDVPYKINYLKEC